MATRWYEDIRNRMSKSGMVDSRLAKINGKPTGKSYQEGQRRCTGNHRVNMLYVLNRRNRIERLSRLSFWIAIFCSMKDAAYILQYFYIILTQLECSLHNIYHLLSND